MSTLPNARTARRNGYPTSDGRPMAETDWHRDLMLLLIEMLKAWYRDKPMVYVSGNLLIFYEQGNKRRHVSPDVFVVKGLRQYDRPNYLLWEEKPLDLVIEVTSSSTRNEDRVKKRDLYRDVLKVKEYFLFDPDGDYLSPRLQGYRLRQGEYHPIRELDGRLPSRVLGLHLEGEGRILRLYDPVAESWLPTLPEERDQLAQQLGAANARVRSEAEARKRAEEEIERLRREIDELRRTSDS